MAAIINSADIPELTGTRYPPPHDAPCRARAFKRLAVPVGVTQFGVNLCRIPPGNWASQRHTHSHDDELVLMLTGALVLIDNDGEHPVGPGDVIGHPAGDGNAHQLVNRSDADATYLVVGSRSDADACTYPDIGMMTTDDRYRLDRDPYMTLAGEPYRP